MHIKCVNKFLLLLKALKFHILYVLNSGNYPYYMANVHFITSFYTCMCIHSPKANTLDQLICDMCNQTV